MSLVERKVSAESADRTVAGTGALAAGAPDEPFLAPASFAQARLWLLDRLHPGLAAYNVPLALSLAGPLDPAALAAALDALAARHETLRTAFVEDADGQPLQAIAPALAIPLPEIDLRALAERSALAPDAAIAPVSPLSTLATLAALESAATRPFDLARPPLLRAFLFRVGEERHVLLLNAHHAVTDAWSVGVLVRDLMALYGELHDGRPAALPELPIQYADFAAWQRDWLRGEALESRLAPWRRRLEGAPASLALPADRPAGAGAGQAGAHLGFELPRPLGAALRGLGRRGGATPFMVLLAGYEALLARLSGQGDLVVGTTVANRDRSEVENLVGLFVNTLALRAELGDDPTFAEHLARVRETALEAFAHADLPFEKLVEELKPERRLTENPLFSAALLFQRPPLAGMGDLGGLLLGLLEIPTGTSKFELSLHLVDAGELFRGSWEYRTALFERATIERFTRRLETALADACAHPERRISELALLDAAERQQVLEWSAAEPAPAAAPLAHEIFAAQAARTPERLAAVFGDASLSYGALHARAGRLARRLRALGAGPERAVAILVERSLDLPVAVLAALAAGAPYVPLDPDYPRQRLALMVEDARAAVLVAQGRLRDRLPAMDLPLALLDPPAADPETPAGEAGAAPWPGADPDDLAYVLFTSGSTGRPKGVAMPHRALANLLAWQLAAGGDQAGRATLQLASLSFDVSFQEIFGTWGAGGTLVLAAEAERRDPEALLDVLDRHAVHRLFAPSIVLQGLAEAAAARTAPRTLRQLVTAGEQLQVTARLRALCARLPGVRLDNHYGPTEAHVVTSLVLVGDPGAWPALPAIGRPIPGAAIRLLDAALAPAAIGAAGELAIGGACLARGYRGRPDLTAERFLPDPCAELPGSRLYRTGDLARFRPDGAIEYLGRADGQVKVRGVRVEPAEIEAALAGHPQVGECAVVPRRNGTDGAGETYLAAYVVARRGGGAPAARELRDYLRGRLPAALVPAAFVELAALPRTPSGKVDRARLPAPPVDAATPAGFVAPRTPVEEILAGIWSAVLRRERIGAGDNFFDLGGHSLNATTVTAQVRSSFGVELPARDLFEAPTLGELAERIERRLAAAEGPELPPITPQPRAGNLPLSFAQQRLWFLDRLAGGASPFYNIGAAIGLRGPLAPAALAAALSAIAQRHEILRTSFREIRGEAVQVVHPAAPLPLPLADLGGLPAVAAHAELGRLARHHGGCPFNLARGPLLRLLLVRLGSDLHGLLLAMHHVVSDGWSLEVLARELTALYTAALEGRPSPLPALPVQYADFAAWQRRCLAGPALDAQLAYWTRRLAGAPFTLDLPTDRPRPPLQTYAGRAELLRLPAPLATDLLALARAARSTLFMVLLAAFAALLERFSGQGDLLLGTPIANRTRAEVEGLIGAFVNTLVLRVELAGDPAFLALLGQVRETALAAYAHQELPFERLVEALQPARDLSRNPLFQASVAMGSTPWHHLELPGVAVGPLDLGPGNELELFDLTFQVFATPAGMDLRFVYNADLFDAATVDRLGRRFEALLAALAADPGRAPATLPLLAPHERQQLFEWSGAGATAADGTGAATAADLFAAQAALRPAAPALAGDGVELSYEELDRRANRLARHLEAAGIGPEAIVAAAVDGAVDLATVVLALWKAGAAYLPLPSDLPPQRIAYLLADSRARLVVTRGRQPEGRSSTVPWLDLGAEAAAIARRDPSPRPAPDLRESAAYLIYTSGSSGRPKGVLVSHAALAAHAVEFARRLALVPGDRVLQVASFAFDVSLDELVPTLLAGATFVPWRPDVVEPAALARALAARAITVVNLPTALWHQAATSWAGGGLPVDAADLGALRWVLVGGEALPPRALELWRRTPLAGVPLANGYGPTEAVVTATLHVPAAAPAPADAADLARLPIGRPFPGRALWLLDRRGEPVPAGAVGEIHLGGAPLARGYLGRPERTAAAFVPDPFAARRGAPGARLYRSGDLARFRADGSLEFIGRRDRQLKVRGFRIEPGEIEAALLAHPGVRQAAVVAAEGAGPDGADAPEYRTLAAYVAAEPGHGAPTTAELRAFLGERLPAYMLPASFAVLPELPTTPGNKIDRAALRAARVPAGGGAPPPAPAADLPGEAVTALTAAAPIVDPAPLEALVAGLWRELLGIEEVGIDDNFFDLGGHSMLVALVLARLQEAAGPQLSMVDLFDHPTVRSLAGRLAQISAAAAHGEAAPAPPPLAAAARAARSDEPIAIVGMAGRFPGANDVEELWRNLRAGVESISFFLPSGERWQPPAGGAFQVPAGGVIEGAELWDAEFFGYGRREAEVIDPQQRLFLESAWEALEDAGYGARRGPRRIAVFGGATHGEYLTVLADRGLMAEPLASELALAGNEKDYLAPRVAYKLGLEGPSFTVSAACSTALVAVHLACSSLLAGECDLALAGGVAVAGRRRHGYFYRPGSPVSPSGRCRPFDAASEGAVDSEGLGVVVLKRLADARADGDTVRAVIRGSALNNDGSEKVGFLAPATAGRAAVIAAALARAGVAPADIGFVEGHGNGTPLGDAIEVAALHQAFGAAGGRGSCALGSVKGNVGHTQSAAGAISLIKATLALERHEIPPTLHSGNPGGGNTEIDLEGGPFYLNTRLQPWESRGAPRRAGVSAFGHGGINVHLVLEEAPPPPAARPARPWQLLLLSARSEGALAAATSRLAAHLSHHPEQDLADVAYTLQVGRQGFARRRAVLCRDRDEAAASLASLDPARVATRAALRREPALVLLLPGAGGGANLGADLYAQEEAFRSAYDGVAERLAPHLGDAAALFAYELALAETLRGWGVRPAQVLGEGVGELAAAVLAGVLALDDAAALVALLDSRPSPAAWTSALRAMPVHRPTIPTIPAIGWISAAAGGRIEPTDAVEAADAERWAERLTAEPRLGAALAPLVADRFRLLLPLGPAAGFVAAARAVAGEAGEAAVTAALPAAADLPEPALALATLGRLWLAGVEIDWAAYHRGDGRRRVPLPTYPFERQRYWIEPPASPAARPMAEAGAPQERS
jgi:amino acid adenylation domain-containing protein